MILVPLRMKSTDTDIASKSPYTFSYDERKWVKTRALSPRKTNTIRSRGEANTMVSPEPQNADIVGDSLGAEEHRVIEWIRDCHQPSLDLMDDVPKIPGLQHFEFTDDRVFVYVDYSPRKSLRVCGSRRKSNGQRYKTKYQSNTFGYIFNWHSLFRIC